MITSKQMMILDRLAEVEQRRLASGRQSYFLDGQHIGSTINSMVVNGLITRDDHGKLHAVGGATLRAGLVQEAMKQTAKPRRAGSSLRATGSAVTGSVRAARMDPP